MKHLMSVRDLSETELHRLVLSALGKGQGPWTESLSGRCVALIFLEASTRTRVSFERSLQRLGAHSILLEAKGSSFEKGETLLDTLLNLKALGVDAAVIRTSSSADLDACKVGSPVPIINAGDGVREHPTQALLDLCTLVQYAGGGSLESLEAKKLLIVGDLAHSRVARSWVELAPRVGLELIFCSPEGWRPKDWGRPLSFVDDKQIALRDADFVMALRVQGERMDSQARQSWDLRYQIALKDLDEDQYLLHPGPVNWGVELAPDLKAFGNSLILKQVQMGLALRAAVLESLLSKSLF
jgi:aspartate carbamoyltransferase catalytic subunit